MKDLRNRYSSIDELISSIETKWNVKVIPYCKYNNLSNKGYITLLAITSNQELKEISILYKVEILNNKAKLGYLLTGITNIINQE